MPLPNTDDNHVTKKTSEVLYQKILNAFYDGVHITDCDGNVLYVNEAFLDLLGETRDNYLNRNIFDMLKIGRASCRERV